MRLVFMEIGMRLSSKTLQITYILIIQLIFVYACKSSSTNKFKRSAAEQEQASISIAAPINRENRREIKIFQSSNESRAKWMDLITATSSFFKPGAYEIIIQEKNLHGDVVLSSSLCKYDNNRRVLKGGKNFIRMDLCSKEGTTEAVSCPEDWAECKQNEIKERENKNPTVNRPVTDPKKETTPGQEFSGKVTMAKKQPSHGGAEKDSNVINIENRCPFPLWIHLIGSITIDSSRALKLDSMKKISYKGLPDFSGGRVFAYYLDPAKAPLPYVVPNPRIAELNPYNQFIEMTLDKAIHYNVSYVDFAALPVTVYAVDPRGQKCTAATCDHPISTWRKILKESCPTEMVSMNKEIGIGRCQASFLYCRNEANKAKAYCAKMEKAYNYPAWSIYGGVSLPRHITPAQIAAWNRGTAPLDANPENYYRNDSGKPYNSFAKWVHHHLQCEVYAFSVDDQQDQAGLEQCQNSKEMNVIWCPSG